MARFAERLFGWSPGRAAERPASFFEADETSAAHEHSGERKNLGFGMFVLFAILAMGAGMVMLMQLAKLMLA